MFRNLKKIPEMPGMDEKVLSQPYKRRILTIVLQKCEKSAVKDSIEKLMLHGFVFNILFKILVPNNFDLNSAKISIG